MNITVEKLLKLPDIYLLINDVIEKLKLEEEKRNQFYETITERDKAEFINGKPIFHSPVKVVHTEVGGRLFHLLKHYVSLYNLGFVGYEKVTLHFTRNSYQPDLCFFTADQRENFTEEQMLYPAPAFVVEVLSPSTEKTDRTIKFNDYAKHGVSEYWIVDPKKKFVEQYVLRENRYKLVGKFFNSKEEKITSEAVAGFSVEAEWLFKETEYQSVFQKEQSELFTLRRNVHTFSEQIEEKDSQIQEQESLIQQKESVIQQQADLLAEKERLIQELLKKLNQ